MFEHGNSISSGVGNRYQCCSVYKRRFIYRWGSKIENVRFEGISREEIATTLSSSIFIVLSNWWMFVVSCRIQSHQAQLFLYARNSNPYSYNHNPVTMCNIMPRAVQYINHCLYTCKGPVWNKMSYIDWNESGFTSKKEILSMFPVTILIKVNQSEFKIKILKTEIRFMKTSIFISSPEGDIYIE